MIISKAVQLIVLAGLVAGFGVPIGVQAGNSVVNNNIQIEANTGGNQANKTIKGESEASVDIKTEVNNRTIEDTSIKKSGQDDLDIKVKSEVTEENGVVEKKTTTNINGDEKTSESRLDLSGKADNTDKASLKSIQSSRNDTEHLNMDANNNLVTTSDDKAIEEDKEKSDLNQETGQVNENRLQTGYAAVTLSFLWDWITSSFSKIISYFV